MAHPFSQRILDFMFEAGRISLKYIESSNPTYKKDQSVLTIADQKISDLLHEKLRDLVQTSEHLIIDEEDPRVRELCDDALLQKAKYIWVCDPIDGTRPYANRMPHFGISLGVLKDRKPWLGAVYFPMMNELFFADGDEAFYISDPFTPKEKRKPITPVQDPLNNRSILMCDPEVFRLFPNYRTHLQLQVSGTSVVDLTWPTIGRGCGAILGPYVWDFCGAWPVAHAAGLKLREIKNGNVLEKIDAGLFKENWRLREYYILSSDENFKTICSHFTGR